MKPGTRALSSTVLRPLLALILLGMSTWAAPPAKAQVLLDKYCQRPYWCAYVVRSDTGKIWFKVKGAEGFTGSLTVCVGKRGYTCKTMPSQWTGAFGYPWTYKLRWQGNFPNQGAGLYYATFLRGSFDLWPGSLEFRVG